MWIVNMLPCRIKGTSFRVIVNNEDQVELSFTRMWDPTLEGKFVPLNIDKRSLPKLWMMFISIRFFYTRMLMSILFQVYTASWFLGVLFLCHLWALEGLAWFWHWWNQDHFQAQKRQVFMIYYILFHIKLSVIYSLNYFKDIISTCNLKTLAFSLYEEIV